MIGDPRFVRRSADIYGPFLWVQSYPETQLLHQTFSILIMSFHRLIVVPKHFLSASIIQAPLSFSRLGRYPIFRLGKTLAFFVSRNSTFNIPYFILNHVEPRVIQTALRISRDRHFPQDPYLINHT